MCAQTSGLSGLPWSELSGAQREALPQPLRQSLGDRYLGATMQWEASRRLLLECARWLGSAGMPFAALKGAALAPSVYRDPGGPPALASTRIALVLGHAAPWSSPSSSDTGAATPPVPPSPGGLVITHKFWGEE